MTNTTASRHFAAIRRLRHPQLDRRPHKALLAEIRRRLDAAREDPNVTNADGSNYWGPYVTRAVDKREHDGERNNLLGSYS
jgi:hypothetical protein